MHPDVLSAGILVADHVCTPIDHVPAAGELVMADRILLTLGGCAANVAVDLAKMGVTVGIAGRVGGDVSGRVVTEMLRDARIDVTHVGVSDHAATSETLIVNVAGQDRRFIHTFGANAEFAATDIPSDAVSRCRILYVGGYFLMPKLRDEEIIPLFQAARQAGAMVALDVVIPKPGEYLPRLERLLPHVDVFLPNNDEALLMTGEKDPARQAELFHRLGARTAVVTMGGNGSLLVGARERMKADVYPTQLIDGSGGGDAFDAGYIYGLLQSMSAEDCLRVASALGASCVRAVGTTTGVFTRAECEAFMKQHTLKIERW